MIYGDYIEKNGASNNTHQLVSITKHILFRNDVGKVSLHDPRGYGTARTKWGSNFVVTMEGLVERLSTDYYVMENNLVKGNHSLLKNIELFYRSGGSIRRIVSKNNGQI